MNISEKLHQLMLRPGFQAREDQETLLAGKDEIERLRSALGRAHEALDQMLIWMPSGFAPQSQGNAMKLAGESRAEIKGILTAGQ